MEVIKYLKQLYLGKNALANHITLFSLLGMLVILLNNVAAYIGTGLVYFNFLAVPPNSKLEFSLDLFFGILISLYLFGYEYKFINENFHDQKIELPEFDLIPSVMILKIFPLFFLWQIYYVLVLSLGSFLLFTFGNMTLVYVFVSLAICTLPFIHMILVKYAYDFSFDRILTCPSTVFKYLDKTLGDIIFLFLQICLLAIIPVGIVCFIAMAAKRISLEPYKLSVYLFDICIGLYFINILKYVYIAGLMNIVKKKLLINRV